MAEDRPLSTANTEYATPAPSLPPSLPVVDSAPLEDLEAPLEPPRRSFLAPGPSIASSPRDSRADSATGPENEKAFTPGQSTTHLQVGKDAEAPLSQPVPTTRPIYRRPVWLAIAAGAIVAVILAVALPVSLSHKTKHTQSNNSGNKPSGNGTGPGNPNSPNNTSNAITGGDGSTITSGNTSFVYKNPYGGYCEFLFLHNDSYVHGRPTGAA
jgi:glucan 1,3-beta-glucosidase